MRKKLKIVVEVIAGLVVFQTMSNIAYLLLPFTLNLLEWNWLTLSSSTSFWAVYWSLRAYWYSMTSVEKMKREAEEFLGTSMVREILKVCEKIEKKWRDLPVERRKELVEWINNMVDNLLSRPKKGRIKLLKGEDIKRK